MKYQETGFRPFYHHFCAIQITEETKYVLEQLHGSEDANGILTYGYVDPEKGNMLEVIATAIMEDTSARFGVSDKKNRVTIAIKDLEDISFVYFGDSDKELTKKYSKKIKCLKQYEADEEIEKTREMVFLDPYRVEDHFDDVVVHLMRDGLESEPCRTRIVGLSDHVIMGTLMDEPEQYFDWHRGDMIAFFMKTMDDGSMICASDMNPPYPVTAEEMADGRLLEEAIDEYFADQNMDSFTKVLLRLRDSDVWVPCHAVMSEVDEKYFNEMVDEKIDDLDSLVGETLTIQENVRLIPVVLTSNEKNFFPVFSSEAVMEELESGVSKVETTMLHAINLAGNNEKYIDGIIVNPLSEQPFVLDREIWDMVENMKTNIVRENK